MRVTREKQMKPSVRNMPPELQVAAQSFSHAPRPAVVYSMNIA